MQSCAQVDGARGTPVAIAAFVTGSVLLSMEIAASRVVSPFFGSSLFVWGALIGVVLTGLALGYALGGALADRRPEPALLIAVMLLGGLAVVVIPVLDEPVLEAVAEWDPGPRANPLVAAVLLFAPASVLLAAVTPIAVRIRASAIDKIGRTAGRLFAVSTVGSIIGTFVTAFWLVPELGTDQLLAFAGAPVFAAAALVAASAARVAVLGLAAVMAAGAVALGLAIAPSETSGELSAVAARNYSPVYRLRGEGPYGRRADYGAARVLFRRDTRYHRLAVTERGGLRELRFGSSYQSGIDVSDPDRAVYAYTDFFDLPVAYNPAVRDYLLLGLGGGTIPRQLLRTFPAMRVDAVELDPVVVDVARRFFDLPEDPRLRVDTSDARTWLTDNPERRFDAIGIDTYFEDAIPFHLTTREFLESVRGHLKPGGLVVANVIGSLSGTRSRLFRSIYRTYRAVFPTVLVHPVDWNPERRDDVRNLILVATDRPAPPKADLAARWRQVAPVGAPALGDAIADRYDEPLPVGDVPTLTDDYAPTDALLTD